MRAGAGGEGGGGDMVASQYQWEGRGEVYSVQSSNSSGTVENLK